jgi:hypothetical protein
MASLTATAHIDTEAARRSLTRKGSAYMAQRADRLGIQMERIIKDMISGEIGPSSGRSRERGMVPMRDINWQHEAINPGTFPVTARLYSPDLASGTPTAAKFGALNYGSGVHEINRRVSFEGTNDRVGDKVVVYNITHPGTEGRDWLFRTAEIARARAVQRFL